jgi:hypothetical protein
MVPKPKQLFPKAGQKKITPPETDGLYRFYTSLHKQNKKSVMAMKWCLEHGVFTKAKAEKAMLQMQMQKLKL